MPLRGKQNVKDAVDNIVKDKNSQLKAIYIKGLQDIVLGTPVDEGRARNSWFLGVGKVQVGSRSGNTNGTGSISDLAKIPKNVLNTKLYFSNNMPYIEKLAYGGYPNPAKNPKKTIGGYSDQQPNRWVTKSILRMRKRIRAIK